MPIINGMAVPHNKECYAFKTGRRGDCDCLSPTPSHQHKFKFAYQLVTGSYIPDDQGKVSGKTYDRFYCEGCLKRKDVRK